MSTSGQRRGNDPMAQKIAEGLDSIFEKIDFINKDWRTQPVEDTLADLHALWDTCITTAIAMKADRRAHEELISQLNGRLGKDGILRRKPRTEDDPLSKRYPLLAEDVLKATLRATKDTKDISEDALGLAVFAAGIVGTLEHNHSNLLFCALVVLREILEKQRRITVREEGTETPVANLLAAAVAWFDIAGSELAGVCLEGFKGNPENAERENMLLAVGHLAQRVDVEKPGFSEERWNFWRARMNELISVDDKEIGEQAQKTMDHMHTVWIGSSTLVVSSSSSNNSE